MVRTRVWLLVGEPSLPMEAGLAKASGLAIDRVTGSSSGFFGGIATLAICVCGFMVSTLDNGGRLWHFLVRKRDIVIPHFLHLFNNRSQRLDIGIKSIWQQVG